MKRLRSLVVILATLGMLLAMAPPTMASPSPAGSQRSAGAQPPTAVMAPSAMAASTFAASAAARHSCSPAGKTYSLYGLDFGGPYTIMYVERCLALELKHSHQYMGNVWSSCSLTSAAAGATAAGVSKALAGKVAAIVSFACGWGASSNSWLADTFTEALDNCQGGVIVKAHATGSSSFQGCQGNSAGHTPHWHLRAFDDQGNCTAYTGTVRESDGKIVDREKVGSCGHAPGSGNIETYTAFVIGDELREALWRGGKGWIRHSALVNGKPNNAAPHTDWEHRSSRAPSRILDAYGGQSTVVVGAQRYTRVFETNGTCHQWGGRMNAATKRFDNSSKQTCSGKDLLPALKQGETQHNISSYTAYIVDDYLLEGMWTNDRGYVRTRPIDPGTGDVDWADDMWWRNDWTQCCTKADIGYVSRGQDGMVLWHN